MNPFEMVVLIVAICVIGGVLRAKYSRGGEREGADTGYSDLRTDQLREEVRLLKERVATLERIATDGSSTLDREIEALRQKKAERLDR
jgi:hypothetical protein